MPELPEVETIARGLDKRVTGDVIESVWIGSKPEPLKSSARAIAAMLEGASIERVHRAGKHIVIDLSKGRKRATSTDLAGHWIVHLGMTGRLLVAGPQMEVAKHTHLIAKLASGRELRFVDPRRFGRLSVVKLAGKDQNGNVFTGTEPLEIEFQAFAALFRKRDTPMKSALLNQKLLRGVGNIYADESLFRAGLRPRRRASSITREQLRKLF